MVNEFLRYGSYEVRNKLLKIITLNCTFYQLWLKNLQMFPGNVDSIFMSQFMSRSSLFIYIQDNLVSLLGFTRCIASWACLKAKRGRWHLIDPAG